MNAIDIARTRLAIDHPFLASAVMRMEWVADNDIPTLAVDGRRGYYSPKWFDTLTLEHQLFCLAHEGMHVMLEHCPMVRAWSTATIGPDGKPYDADRMNRAMDYLINGSLLKEGFKAPPLPGGGRVCHDVRWNLDSDLIAVYRELEQSGGSGSSGGNGGQAMDEHRPAEGDPVMDAADVKAAAHVHKAVNSGREAGKDSPLVRSVLRRFDVPDESPWAILRDKMSRGSPTKTTWSRPNRHLLARGIIAPSTVSEVSEPIAVVVDISGSCVDMIPLFLSHIAAIVTDTKPQSLLIAFTNTRVVKTWETQDAYAMANGLNEIEVPEGGGTDMRVGIDFAEKSNYNRVVVLTDGETPFPHNPTADIIWALTRTDIRPPCGQSVYLTA